MPPDPFTHRKSSESREVQRLGGSAREQLRVRRAGGVFALPRTKAMNDTMIPSTQGRLLAQLAMIPACQRSQDGADWFPPVDILEDEGEYLFKIDLPEVKVEDIQVAVEGDVLVISGERPNPWRDARKHLRIERPYGYFERRFPLPDDADKGAITTLLADSVLEVQLRKANAQAQAPSLSKAPPRLKLRAAA